MLPIFIVPLPQGNVRDDVFDRPGACDTRLEHLRVRQTCVGRIKRVPRLVQSLQKLRFIHVLLRVGFELEAIPPREGQRLPSDS